MVRSTATGTFVQLCSLSAKNGIANINPFAHAALATAASVTDPSTVFANPDSTILQKAAANLPGAVSSLKDKLSPLFQMYGTSQNPITDKYTADHTGLDALFDDVDFRLAAGWLNVKNRGTGGVIFSAAVNNISSGAFNSGNMPVVPGLIYGVSLYTNYCASCHGVLTASTKIGKTADQITGAISSESTMTTLSSLTSIQIQAIATVLSQNITAMQASCSYTYDAWGTCQSDGNQTRTVLSSTPDGCVGIPILSQPCAYVLPVPMTCTYTYDDWGACQPDDTQTRNLLSSSPAGCTGTPVLTQSCTYTPPTCTFTYDAWGPCQPDNTQTRNVLTTSPADCTGLPFVTQYCPYTPPLTLAQVTTSCTTCHALTVNTTVLAPRGYTVMYTVIGRSSADWLTTVNTMVGQHKAILAPGTTAQDYANFLAGLP